MSGDLIQVHRGFLTRVANAAVSDWQKRNMAAAILVANPEMPEPWQLEHQEGAINTGHATVLVKGFHQIGCKPERGAVVVSQTITGGTTHVGMNAAECRHLAAKLNEWSAYLVSQGDKS